MGDQRTLIVMTLDESGSMNRDATIEAFNQFLEQQRERLTTLAYLTLIKFNGITTVSSINQI